MSVGYALNGEVSVWHGSAIPSLHTGENKTRNSTISNDVCRCVLDGVTIIGIVQL